MPRLLLAILLSLFAVQEASASNFRLLKQYKPSGCFYYDPSATHTTEMCYSSSLLVDADTSDIYECNGQIWVTYDNTNYGQLSDGGSANCNLQTFPNYPANTGKSDYSFLHDIYGLQNIPTPGVTDPAAFSETFWVAKSDVFSVTVCMNLSKVWGNIKKGVGYANCFDAPKNVAPVLPPAIPSDLADFLMRMTHINPAK